MRGRDLGIINTSGKALGEDDFARPAPPPPPPKESRKRQQVMRRSDSGIKILSFDYVLQNLPHDNIEAKPIPVKPQMKFRTGVGKTCGFPW